MRWGIGVVALVAVLGLVVPGGPGTASGATYEEAPIYAPAPLPKPRLRFSGFRRNLRSGTAILFVSVPGPGRAVLHGRGIRRVVRFVGRAMRLRLVVRPKVRLMHYLKHHRKGVIRAMVTFTPDDESGPVTIERPIALKRRHV